MKKKVTITAVVIICILLVVAVALSANRAGGEIGFEATINSVENPLHRPRRYQRR